MLLGAVGCGGSHAATNRPVPSLASTPEAQRDFRILRENWRTLSVAERDKLVPSLRAYLESHPDDGRAPLVRVYLALVLMELERPGEARRVLAPLRATPAGATRDFARVARAALWLSEGKPSRARAQLEPLRGKLIDADERLLYGELLVKSALAEKHLPEAVLDMRWWLAEVDPADIPRVKAKVSGYITRFERGELEQARAWLAEEQGPGSPHVQAIDEWLERQVTAELARSALHDKDSALARSLIASDAAQLPDAKTRDELNRLASSGEQARRVVGRTVGLVLSLESADVRTRSSQVSAGVMHALGLPARSGSPPKVQLLVEDDVEGMRSALAGLAAGGASILIAGMDRQGAEQAATFAEEAAIPLVLIEPGAPLPQSADYAFSVGLDRAQLRESLLGAIAARDATVWREVDNAARVDPTNDAAATRVLCEQNSVSAGVPRFPVLEWKQKRVDALLLLGDESCSRAVLDELGNTGHEPLLAFGLESAPVALRRDLDARAMVAHAGRFPGAGSGAPRSWYEALGHDAASLADAALSGFPSETADDARIVADLHMRARDRLLSVAVDLWTSEQRGFGGQHQLARKIEVAVRHEGQL